MQHPQKKKRKKGMSLRWALLLMAAAVLAAAAFVLLVPSIRQRYPAAGQQVVAQQPSMQALHMRAADEVESATVFPKGAESYRLKMQDGALYLQADGELTDLNDAFEQDLLAVFTQVVVQETVARDAAQVQQHLADMGLAPAQARAEIRYQDGTEAVLELGGAVPHTSFFYYRWSGDPGVYMCDAGIAETLSLSARQLLPIEQPRIAPSLVDEVEITNAHGTSRFVFEKGTFGSLAEPYDYPLSQEGLTTLLTALQNFRLGVREAAVTDENRAFYGFDQPLCTVRLHQTAGMVNDIDQDGALVTLQREEQSLLFVIGRAEGEYFYTCEYEGACYFISRFLAEALVGADAESLITRYPLALVGDDPLAALRVQGPKGTLEVRVERVEQVLANNQLALDSQGNVQYKERITFNGQEVSREQLDALEDRMSTFAAVGDVPSDFALREDAVARWQMALVTQGGRTRRVEAYRMDAFSDAIAVDGVIRHHVHADAIEAFMAGLIP